MNTPLRSLQSDQKSLALVGPMPGSDTLVFLPTYNECGNIERMIDALLSLPISCDLFVVDDRSTDGTTDILLRLAAVKPRLSVLVRAGKLGVGSAHVLGWMFARRRGYRRIATLDADFSHDPADVPRLLAALDAGADVAIGSRFAPGGQLDYSGWRLLVSRSANYLVRAMLRLPLSEYTTALRAARLDRVPEGLVETITNDGYAFFFECAVRFVRAGLTITEVPIHFHERTHGTSKISQVEIVRGVLNLLRLKVQRTSITSTAANTVGAQQRCAACDQPFLRQTLADDLRCLSCGHRARPSADSALNADLSAAPLHGAAVSGTQRCPPAEPARADGSDNRRSFE
jgi:dolichol-phosphate mannosyltransferase